MHRLIVWLILVGVFTTQPTFAQDKPQPLLAVAHNASIGGARWQSDSHHFWTWSRRFFLTSGNADYEDSLQFWNGETGALTSELLYRGDNVAMRLDWSAGENRVLVYSGQTLEVWDAVRGAKLWVFAYAARISGARWNADFSRILFWSYDDGSIHIWDTQTDRQLFVAETDFASNLVQVVWSPDEKRLAAVLTQSPGRVEIWDVATAQRTTAFDYAGMLYQAEWNADGTRLLVIGDNTIQLVDVVSRAVLLGKRDAPYLYRANWSPDRHRVAIRVENASQVEIWDTSAGKVMASITHAEHSDNNVFEILWSADNQRVLTHSADKIAVWDTSDGMLVFQLAVEARRFAMSWLAWSPDEQQIVLLRSDSSLQIVTPGTQAAVELEMPTPVKLSFPAPIFAWNKDYSQVMLTGIDNTARVWDTATGTLLATFEHPIPTGFQAADVNIAIWSPDAQRILTVGVADYCGGLDSCPSETRIWRSPA